MTTDELEPTRVRRAPAAADEPEVRSTDPAFGDDKTVVRGASGGDPLIGAMLGEYRVLAPLGQGGVGLVYRGEHSVIGRPVAIKLLRPEFARDPNHARRFLEEARSLSAARHPGIIDVLTFGEGPDGTPYLVMELLEGEPLDDLLRRRVKLPPAEVLTLALPMLSALSAAHDVGVVHRDLKPGNLFIVTLRDGTTFPKLLDFGFARRGEVGAPQRQTTVGGTPLYIAPEQARGEAVTAQTDLYSFGCVLYELLTGRPPFVATDLAQLLDQHFTLAPEPLGTHVPGVAAELEAVVLQMLEKDPARRPASALEVRTRLERVQAARPRTVRKPAPAPASEPVSAPPPTKVDRLRAPTPASEPTQPSLERRARSGPPPALLVGLVLVIALTAGALLWWGRSAAPPQASVPAPRVTPPEPTPTKGPSAPEPRPEPPTEPKLDARPAPTVDAPPTKPRAPAKSARTAADVNRRWEALWKRSQRLPEDLRRLAQLKLTQAGDCSGSPDACWAELTELETTFFPK